jgi:hypothetical protein
MVPWLFPWDLQTVVDLTEDEKEEATIAAKMTLARARF